MEPFIIYSEETSHHWKYFDFKNHNVLDLGCGRWSVRQPEEMSPIYFYNNGANLVVGVDADNDEINYYQDNFGDKQNMIFILKKITSTQDVIDLISQYNITALKCDIEGEEQWLLDLKEEHLLNITELAIEYHNPHMLNSFLDILPKWGYTIKLDAPFKGAAGHAGVLFSNK